MESMIDDFINERCETGKGFVAPFLDIFNEWCDYSNFQFNNQPVAFGKEMRKRGFVNKLHTLPSGRQCTGMYGIRLKPSE